MAKADDSSAKFPISTEPQDDPAQESTTSKTAPGFTTLTGVFMFLVLSLIIRRT
jgi:hypothetical protein